MNAVTRAFVQHVVSICAQVGVTCSLIPVKVLTSGGCACGGVFSAEQRVLSVATDQPRSVWVGVLAHEFAHFQQWRSNCQLWQDYPEDGDYLVGEWLNHRVELTAEQSAHYLIPMQRLELDAERRALRLLAKWELGVDLQDYSLRASAYVASYHVVAQYRVWLAPYMLTRYHKKIADLIPERLQPARWYWRWHEPLYSFLRDKCMAPLDNVV